MQETTIYQCINPDCGRTMPRRVAFCPYCGTAQAPAGPARMPAPPVPAPAPAPEEGGAAPFVPTPAPAPERREPAPAPPPAPSATDFGRNGGGGDGPAHAAHVPPHVPPPPRPEPVPTPPPPRSLWGRGPAQTPPRAPARPSGRQPVRLRWWILILAALAALWVWGKPSTRKIERRIDHAIELARECKAREAQDELIALRKERATPKQLARLQEALNEEAAACTRRRQREKAWRETNEAVEAALAAPTGASLDRARSRVAAYTRRWGEDERSRALLERIEAERHPLAAPGAR